MKRPLLLALSLSVTCSFGQSSLKAKINAKAESIDSKVVTWRRDIHQNPEL